MSVRTHVAVETIPDGRPLATDWQVVQYLACALAICAALWGALIGLGALIVWAARTTVPHAAPYAVTTLVALALVFYGALWVRDRVLDARDRRRRRRRVLDQIRAIDRDPSWQRLRDSA